VTISTTRQWQKVWPDWVRDDFNIEAPITENLRHFANEHPHKTALDFYGTEMTYQELNEKIDRFAWGLVNLGLRIGDRVCLQMPNSPHFIISYFGILRAGGVVVAVNPMFKTAELEYEINDATPHILICSSHLYQYVDQVKDKVELRHIIVADLSDSIPDDPTFPLPAEVQPLQLDVKDVIPFTHLLDTSPAAPICRIFSVKTELALLQYTGGTTGMPKGAMISHYGLAMAAHGVANWFKITPEDTCLGVAPFFHIMGMIPGMCSLLATGAKLVILSRFVVNTVASALERHRVTAWHTSTTMLIALLQTEGIEKFNFNSLRLVANGGATISTETLTRFNMLMPQAKMVDGYGLTECISHGGACTPIDGYRPGFVGVPHLNDIKIVDTKTGEYEMATGEEGEIVLKGPALMVGYWQHPDESRKAFRNGWFHTGDIGAMDEHGYLKLLGRNKELIKCSGFSVFPDEVENLMYHNNAVAEVAVIGVPDSYRGESPKAFVVLAPGFKGKITEKEVQDWCKKNMAAYKCPGHIVFTESLPKSAAGKILRRLLKSTQMTI